MIAGVATSNIESNQRLVALLKELRGNSSYREFAATIGTTHTNVRQWESGKGEPRLRVLGKLAALRGWTLDELMIYLEGELPPEEPRITQLLAEVRSLSLEAVAQVAAVAVETLAIRGITSQAAKGTVSKATSPEEALTA